MGEIVLYDQLAQQGAMKAIETLGNTFARSQMFGLSTPQQGQVVAMACLVERKSPLDIMKTYHVIEGTLSKRAEKMLAEFQARGGRLKFVEHTDEACEIVFTHPEYQPDGLTIRFELKDLIAKGVAKGKDGIKTNYKKSPRQMLRARCISDGIRAVDPEVVCGTYTPEEVSDFSEKHGAKLAARWSRRRNPRACCRLKASNQSQQAMRPPVSLP